MPQYQRIAADPNPLADAAGKFGEGLMDVLSRARKQKQQQDLLDSILGKNSVQNEPGIDRQVATSYPVSEMPNNIADVRQSMEQNPASLARQGIVSGKAPNSNRLNKLTPEKYAAINMMDPGLAKALQPAYEAQQGKEKEGLKSDVKRSTEFLTKVDKMEEALPRKRLALRQIEDAVKNRSSIDFAKDILADAPGMEFLRSAKGAQLLSSTKEFFLSDLGSIPGLRPNQFLEKALSSALTDTRRTQEANEMVLAGLKSNVKLDEARTYITRQFEDYYRNNLGYIPASISSDVNKALLPYAEQLQNEWATEVNQIEQKHDKNFQKFEKFIDKPEARKRAAKEIKLKKVGPGTILSETMGMVLLDKYNDDEEKALDAARKLGYTIPGE